VNHTIYWTDDKNKTISRAKIKDDGPVNSSDIEVVHKFDSEYEPHGLVLDHCRK
jgi:sugar lactone lactonase YvrE